MIYDHLGRFASPKSQSECPACRGKIVAKCGRIVSWHWAHLAADCDPWAEPESQWHLAWKERLRRAGASVEVVIGPHRADAVLPNGVVVELQSSYLSVDQIEERERFYGRMVWLYRAHWWDRIHYGTRGFWWKHGAKSLAAHRRPLLWHFPENDVVWKVSLGLVDNGDCSRVVGKVKGRTDSAGCVSALLAMRKRAA